MRIYFDIPLGREVHERHLRERPGCHRHHRLLWTSLAKVKIPIILSAPSKRSREVLGNPSRDPRDISRVEGNLEGRGDGSSNNSRVLVEYGHSIHHRSFPRKCIGKSFPVDRQGWAVSIGQC